jgi:hypothetical protein
MMNVKIEDMTEAYRVGFDHGEEKARQFRRTFPNRDRFFWSELPEPLSGEWAGESFSELSDAYGVDLNDDDNADDFESGFADGWRERLLAEGCRVNNDDNCNVKLLKEHTGEYAGEWTMELREYFED